MSDTVREFYDNLADSYHLIGRDWDQVIRDQGKLLSALIAKTLAAKGPFRIYDCSCGIGTQALGLALEGHRLCASDLSEKAVEQAKANAARLGVEVKFQTADFRNLSRVAGRFDAIISCDNALPHLESKADMLLALKEMHLKLEVGGLLLFSTRDYDQLLQERPPGMMPRTLRDSQGKRIYFQTWEWAANAPAYEVNLFILTEQNSSWATKAFHTRYRAWRRSELTTLMKEAGYHEIQWLMPEESGYYQPLALARRA